MYFSLKFQHWKFGKSLANISALLAAKQKLLNNFFLQFPLLTFAFHCVNYMLAVYNNFFPISFRDFLFGFL